MVLQESAGGKRQSTWQRCAGDDAEGAVIACRADTVFPKAASAARMRWRGPF